MPYNRRLRDYDYRQPGGYFVTINSYHREEIFSAVTKGIIELTPTGEIIKRCWTEIPLHFMQVNLGAYVIMPDHIHGIIIINYSRDYLVAAKHASPLPDKGLESLKHNVQSEA